jgi:hypothetical protein
MVTSTSRGVRVAAGIVCAAFAAFVLVHLLWAVGIVWGLEEVSSGGLTDASLSLTVVSLAAAAVGTAAIVVTLGRVGWLETRLSDRLLHIGAWLVFTWPAVGTLNPATPWGQRAVTLPLAIAALVVARSRPWPRVGEAQRPPVTRIPVAH